MAEKPERGPKDEIEDWMYGAGGKVFAAVVILLVGWFVIYLFI